MSLLGCSTASNPHVSLEADMRIVGKDLPKLQAGTGKAGILNVRVESERLYAAQRRRFIAVLQAVGVEPIYEEVK